MKLFITDLDGTLLDENHQASETNIQALQALKQQGYEIVIASGRQYPDIKAMGLHAYASYVIAQNGSLIYDALGNVLYGKPLSAKQAYEVCNYCEAHNLLYLVYTQEQMLTHLPTKFIHLLYDIAKTRSSNEVELLNLMELYYDMYATLPSFDQTKLEQVKTGACTAYKIEICGNNQDDFTQFEIRFQDNFSVTSSWDSNREITALQVNKGSAITALCEILETSLSNCIAIGDNRNDIEMLQVCGHSIAMGNASVEIQAMCDETTQACEAQGVAKAIQRILKQA